MKLLTRLLTLENSLKKTVPPIQSLEAAIRFEKEAAISTDTEKKKQKLNTAKQIWDKLLNAREAAENNLNTHLNELKHDIAQEYHHHLDAICQNVRAEQLTSVEQCLKELKTLEATETYPQDHSAKKLQLVLQEALQRDKITPSSIEAETELPVSLIKAVPNARTDGFNRAIYNSLLPFTQLLYTVEQNGIPEDHAYKLAMVFANKTNALNYLDKYKKNNPDEPQPLHQACLFVIPEGEFNLTIWRKLAMKYSQESRFWRLFTYASDIETSIYQDSKQKVNKQDIKDLISKISELNKEWKKLRRHRRDFTDEDEECFEKLTQVISERYIALSKAYAGTPFSSNITLPMLKAYHEKYLTQASETFGYFLKNGLTRRDYNKFTELKRVDDDERIPNMTIDGAELGFPGFYLMKIPVLDELHAARAACLGKITGCCQSLSGEAGEPCTIHGLTSKEGGFYVVCQGDAKNPKVGDEVYAQTWASRRTNEAIVFDSIEINKKMQVNTKVKSMIAHFYHHLGYQLVKQGHTTKVGNGARSGISRYVGAELSLDAPETFIDYDDYHDSYKQHIIYKKDAPYYLIGTEEFSEKETVTFIQKLLESEEPLNQLTPFSRMLNWALLSGDAGKKVIGLIRAQAGNRLDKVNSALIMTNEYLTALKGKNIIKLYELIMAGSNPNLRDESGTVALMLAAKSGKTEMALKLIAAGADVNAQTNSGATALKRASREGYKDLAMTLIEKGADVNVQDKRGKTALMHALRSGHEDLAMSLIGKAADVNLQNMFGETALMYAVTNAHKDLTMTLIKKGADVNLQDRYGSTALLNAIESGSKAISMTLIEKATDLDLQNEVGKTALMFAAENGSKEIAINLIEKGANVNLQDAKENTALMYAVEQGYKEIAMSLIENGADVNHTKTNSRWTSLRYAIQNGHEDLAMTLIAKGADVNAQTKSGQTALMVAADKGYEDLAIKLIAAGADVTLKNHRGETSINMARLERYRRAINALIEAGGGIHKESKVDKTIPITIDTEQSQQSTTDLDKTQPNKIPGQQPVGIVKGTLFSERDVAKQKKIQDTKKSEPLTSQKTSQTNKPSGGAGH